MTSPSNFLRFSITYSSIVLLYYDYILTFPKEVKYIWGGKLRISTLLLYIGCRYALVANVLYLFSIADEIGLKARYKVASALAVVGRTSIIDRSSVPEMYWQIAYTSQHYRFIHYFGALLHFDSAYQPTMLSDATADWVVYTGATDES
ncbi:hypothetical protein BDQ17DRAFT_1321216 [Cyathus striatus]|nr:hypothetical protein BDQ17DRAFT_1321216 [Cyathus striatus]